MRLLGIDLIFLHEPLQNRFAALAAGAWAVFMGCFNYISILLYIYALFTPFVYPLLLYTIWMYIDRPTCQNGGRPNRWFQKLAFWKYLKNHFPGRLVLVPNFELNPKKNYLFCCFPHGLYATGTIVNLIIQPSEIRRKYPAFSVRLASLGLLYSLPFFREVMLALGGISCSMQSLRYVLSKPEGGYLVALVPGGTAEMLEAHPGRYKLVIKNRKGFVKVALKTGASLVPTITFCENDLFDQITNPILSKIQIFMQKRLGAPLVLFRGRGFLQNSFGVIPRNKTLTTVAGIPIDVEKTDDPTQEKVDSLHERFIKELVNLFETYKHNYVENAEATHLELA